ncbi:MAG: DUF134 domain-containing protein [Sphaerochaetaceae bacterium]|nr:DUF134 domain-containing protein [Sphaerochaetaceae bacterium]
MPRPKKERTVYQPPLYADFKPQGVQRRELACIDLELDEFEAIRLADYLEMDHAEAAIEMGISRSTFTRLVERSRKKMAQFLIEGRHLHIGGGNIHFHGNVIRCRTCGHMFNIGFDKDLQTCPACGSSDLIDLAGGFGHGRCCREHGHRHRR